MHALVVELIRLINSSISTTVGHLVNPIRTFDRDTMIRSILAPADMFPLWSYRLDKDACRLCLFCKYGSHWVLVRSPLGEAPTAIWEVLGKGTLFRHWKLTKAEHIDSLRSILSITTGHYSQGLLQG